MDPKHYAPPNATVDDVPPPGRGQPPVQAVLAVRMLWFSLFLGLPGFYWGIEQTPTRAVAVFMVIFGAILFAFVAFLNVSIGRGRNWARIAYLIFTIVGLLIVDFELTRPEASVIENILSGVCLILDIAAMVLVFTRPGSAWFKART